MNPTPPITIRELQRVVESSSTPIAAPRDELYERVVFALIEAGNIKTLALLADAATITEGIRGYRAATVKTEATQ